MSYQNKLFSRPKKAEKLEGWGLILERFGDALATHGGEGGRGGGGTKTNCDPHEAPSHVRASLEAIWFILNYSCRRAPLQTRHSRVQRSSAHPSPRLSSAERRKGAECLGLGLGRGSGVSRLKEQSI